MQKVKLRLANGNLSVYLVEAPHQTPEAITAYGSLKATQFHGKWYRIAWGSIRHPLPDAESAELDALPLAFDAPHDMWGMQVRAPERDIKGVLQRAWDWITGPQGPYKYHTEEEAYHGLYLAHPNAVLGVEVRITTFT